MAPKLSTKVTVSFDIEIPNEIMAPLTGKEIREWLHKQLTKPPGTQFVNGMLQNYRLRDFVPHNIEWK